jgi:hypothetical protein
MNTTNHTNSDRPLDTRIHLRPSGGSTEGEILNILSGFKLVAEPRAMALFQYLEARGLRTQTATRTSAIRVTCRCL